MSIFIGDTRLSYDAHYLSQRDTLVHTGWIFENVRIKKKLD